MDITKLTNKEFQALGRSKRLLRAFLLDDEGGRVREIPKESVGAFKDSEKELVYSEVLSYTDCMSTLGQAVF